MAEHRCWRMMSRRGEDVAPPTRHPTQQRPMTITKHAAPFDSARMLMMLQGAWCDELRGKAAVVGRERRRDEQIIVKYPRDAGGPDRQPTKKLKKKKSSVME